MENHNGDTSRESNKQKIKCVGNFWVAHSLCCVGNLKKLLPFLEEIFFKTDRK